MIRHKKLPESCLECQYFDARSLISGSDTPIISNWCMRLSQQIPIGEDILSKRYLRCPLSCADLEYITKWQ